MTKSYAIGLCAVITVTIIFLLYDSFDMDMYQCSSVQIPSLRSAHLGTDITREYSSAQHHAPFDIKGKDVLVLVHIQKTGGSSFGRHIVKDLDIERPCLCKRGTKACDCRRPGSDNKVWLFSEFSVGWSCSLHADWTEMTSCVPSMLNKHEHSKQKRRYFYATILREPQARFLSEWQHSSRGATWKTSLHMCDGRIPSADEFPRCYKGINWKDVNLDEYLSCPYNLAFNRQTRMLANLSDVGCYDLSKFNEVDRRAKMLASAKRNLHSLAFFGIMEYQKETQELFEYTFKMYFKKDFTQANTTHAGEMYSIINEKQVQEIRRVNAEDLQLYDYAKVLFWERVKAMKGRHKPRRLDETAR